MKKIIWIQWVIWIIFSFIECSIITWKYTHFHCKKFFLSTISFPRLFSYLCYLILRTWIFEMIGLINNLGWCQRILSYSILHPVWHWSLMLDHSEHWWPIRVWSIQIKSWRLLVVLRGQVFYKKFLGVNFLIACGQFRSFHVVNIVFFSFFIITPTTTARWTYNIWYKISHF